MQGYKLPFFVDLEYGKKAVEDFIRQYGKSWDINELALTVYCEQDGNKFEIVQWHRNRRYVEFLASN